MSSLDDELLSINSIYAPDTLELVDDQPSNSSSSNITVITTTTTSSSSSQQPKQEETKTCILRPPSLPGISIRIAFPAAYPDEPPLVLGTQTVGEGLQKGTGARVVELLRDTLGRVFVPGVPVVFELLEECGVVLEGMVEDDDDDGGEGGRERVGVVVHGDGNGNGSGNRITNEDEDGNAQEQQQQQDDWGEPQWIVSEPLVEKKSVFVARVATVSSPAQAQAYLAHLLAADRHVARATHNITAYRINGSSGSHVNNNSSGNSNRTATSRSTSTSNTKQSSTTTTMNPAITYQDSDDDGETAAGSRVLHLMQLMDVWDVLVVVTRWYGGVLLGPDRFRCINQVAREGLVKGGFVVGAGEDAGGGGGKGGGGKKKKGGRG